MEKDDFVVRFEGPRMLLSGRKHSGEVRWLQALNAPKRDVYRDKYIKFAWSSHFPFNVSSNSSVCPCDQALIFVDGKTGALAARAPAGVTSGELLEDGVETTWWALVGQAKVNVVTRLRLVGDFEQRTHRITVPPEAGPGVFAMEGSYPLALPITEKVSELVRSPQGVIGLWVIRGESDAQLVRFPENVMRGETMVLSVRWRLEVGESTVATLHYASRNPLPLPEILDRAQRLVNAWVEPT